MQALKSRPNTSGVRELFIALTHVPALLRHRRLVDGHEHRIDERQINAVLEDAKQNFSLPLEWYTTRLVPTLSDVAVVHVGSQSQQLQAFLKLARSGAAAAGLDSQSATLAALHVDEALGDWRRLVPVEIGRGRLSDQAYVIEAALPGVDMAMLKSTQAWLPALNDAVACIAALHETQGALRIIDDELFDEWCEPALRMLATLRTSWSSRQRLRYVDNLRQRLQKGLVGRNVWTSRIHGDFSPNNLLVHGQKGCVTGIIDWDRSHAGQPSFLDVGQLAIGAAHEKSGLPVGEVVRRICAGDNETLEELALLNYSQAKTGDAIDLSVVALMTWLRHIESNIDKAPRYATHRLWIYQNVQTVLKTC